MENLWYRRPDVTLIMPPRTGDLNLDRPDWRRRPDATDLASSTGDSRLPLRDEH
jgi:hypothetical protein